MATETKLELSGVKPGDELIRVVWSSSKKMNVRKIATVERRTPKRIYTTNCNADSHYQLNGAGMAGASGYLRLPGPGELEEVRREIAEEEAAELLERQAREKAAQERESQPGYQEARRLTDFGALDAEDLLNRYGADRVIAAWKVLNE